MDDKVETGRGKRGRRIYSFDEIVVAPSRRIHDPEDVSLSWQFDAYYMRIPMMGALMDSVMSPENAIRLEKLGGTGVLDLEGLWTRYPDPLPLYRELAELGQDTNVTTKLQQIYAEPVKPDLVRARLQEIKGAGVMVAGAISSAGTRKWWEEIVGAPLDVHVVHGFAVSTDHVSSQVEPLNLKQFIHHLDIPVVVDGVATHTGALYLIRTGAAGVLVGFDGGAAPITRRTMGIHVPMVTAVAGVAAARRDLMDGPSGRYVHVIVDGGIGLSGDIVKATTCGADTVMLETALARVSEAPGQGWHWGSEAHHSMLPRGSRVRIGTVGTLEQVLFGPADNSEGILNLAGALRRTMTTTGYIDVKELQRVGVVIG